ncbi:MAG: hypothetical protein RM021_024660 [Nostoc sp. EkiNYC01]|nr:hypothetical protein [Nostoc sp. EkiNYC01]
MTDSNSLLSLYEELVQNHISQFDPQIADLQQLVKARMQEIRDAEQSLVETQAIELKRITDALATDARCLLPTPGLRAFVQELKQTKSNNWYTRKSEFSIAEDSTTWLLAMLELPIGLSNYQIHEDLNGYDDERNFIGYSYTLSLKLGLPIRDDSELCNCAISTTKYLRSKITRNRLNFFDSSFS